MNVVATSASSRPAAEAEAIDAAPTYGDTPGVMVGAVSLGAAPPRTGTKRRSPNRSASANDSSKPPTADQADGSAKATPDHARESATALPRVGAAIASPGELSGLELDHHDREFLTDEFSRAGDSKKQLGEIADKLTSWRQRSAAAAAREPVAARTRDNGSGSGGSPREREAGAGADDASGERAAARHAADVDVLCFSLKFIKQSPADDPEVEADSRRGSLGTTTAARRSEDSERSVGVNRRQLETVDAPPHGAAERSGGCGEPVENCATPTAAAKKPRAVSAKHGARGAGDGDGGFRRASAALGVRSTSSARGGGSEVRRRSAGGIGHTDNRSPGCNRRDGERSDASSGSGVHGSRSARGAPNGAASSGLAAHRTPSPRASPLSSSSLASSSSPSSAASDAAGARDDASGRRRSSNSNHTGALSSPSLPSMSPSPSPSTEPSPRALYSRSDARRSGGGIGGGDASDGKEAQLDFGATRTLKRGISVDHVRVEQMSSSSAIATEARGCAPHSSSSSSYELAAAVEAKGGYIGDERHPNFIANLLQQEAAQQRKKPRGPRPQPQPQPPQPQPQPQSRPASSLSSSTSTSRAAASGRSSSAALHPSSRGSSSAVPVVSGDEATTGVQHGAGGAHGHDATRAQAAPPSSTTAAAMETTAAVPAGTRNSARISGSNESAVVGQLSRIISAADARTAYAGFVSRFPERIPTANDCSDFHFETTAQQQTPAPIATSSSNERHGNIKNKNKNKKERGNAARDADASPIPPAPASTSSTTERAEPNRTAAERGAGGSSAAPPDGASSAVVASERATAMRAAAEPTAQPAAQAAPAATPAVVASASIGERTKVKRAKAEHVVDATPPPASTAFSGDGFTVRGDSSRNAERRAMPPPLAIALASKKQRTGDARPPRPQTPPPLHRSRQVR